MIRFRPIRLGLACVLLAAPAIANAAWVNGTVTSEQAMVRRQPSDAAELLGHLRAGKTIRIYTPDRGGYYAINFGKEIKGTKIGWISTADVQVDASGGGATAAPAAGTRQVSRSGQSVKPSWLD